MSRIDDAIRATNWEDYRAGMDWLEACIAAGDTGAHGKLKAFIDAVTAAAIADRLVDEDTVTGMKDFTITRTYKFYLKVRARNKYEAAQIDDDEDGANPTLSFMDDEYEGDFDSSQISLGSRY